ncbi:MAG: dipeptide epimerase [Bacteroidetes bacterium]|nr:dipeptide epimerase [Bacteroidota bacterium]
MKKVQNRKSTMVLRWQPYTLELKHQFTIAVSSRKTTPIVLTEIEYDGVVGYGEASLPPYLGETQESVGAFLSKVNLSQYTSPFELEHILSTIDKLAPGNTAAKASIDIALHDLVGKLLNRPLYQVWGFSNAPLPPTSFTIGIDTPRVVREKTEEAHAYPLLKVKLGRESDKEMIETIRSVTGKPITADVNQGWNDKYYALDMIHWLHDRGVILIEQPLPKDRIDDLAWLYERSPIPIIGDEGIQRLTDVPNAVGVYHGINIKLMKCTGLREAQRMLFVARALGLKVMIGCMTETSCAISAAAHLTPLADWADLDGALLISNDAFDGVKIHNGTIIFSENPGIGVIKKI